MPQNQHKDLTGADLHVSKIDPTTLEALNPLNNLTSVELSRIEVND